MVRRPGEPFPFARVERLWPDSTVVCIGSGPSLTQSDVDRCRGEHVIAVNDAYRLAPWAEVLYACDYRWWNAHKGVPNFSGRKYALQAVAAKWPDVQVLRNTGVDGLERDPGGLRTGTNSGYQALNLALHVGARRIVLLGYDMGHRPRTKSHFFGEHPQGLRVHSPYANFIAHFAKAAPLFRKYDVAVVNASRDSALTCFPRQTLEEALAPAVAMAS